MMDIVRDLMVPVEEYVTVNQDMTVKEAIQVLNRVRVKYTAAGKNYKPRELIVLNRENQVVGKLSQIEIVMAMEPKYRTEKGDEAISHTSSAGLSPELLKSMMQWYSLWGESFSDRCQKVVNMTVKECVHSPRRDEFIKETETLETAVHQLVMGRHRSLLVTRDNNITGVLRLSDVFQQIAQTSKEP